MTKVTKIGVHCWNCGKLFYIEPANVYAGQLFCSERCWKENMERGRKLEKEEREGKR